MLKPLTKLAARGVLAAAITLCCAPRAGSVFISGGGFPAGTRIAATSGSILIEDIKPGNKILAFSGDTLIQSTVRDTYKKESILLTLTTTKGKLVTTRNHLMLTWKGFTEAEKLKPEDEVAVLKNGRRVWAGVKRVKAGKLGLVYNIETGPPHTFIANDFLVHN